MSKKRVEQYLRIEDWGESESGKTRVWRVYNFYHRNVIGFVKWYGGFRRYCFYPEIEDVSWITFDSDCLRMVADFLDKVNAKHRESKVSSGTI